MWSSGQSFWLQIQRSRVRSPALPDFLSSSGSGMGSNYAVLSPLIWDAVLDSLYQIQAQKLSFLEKKKPYVRYSTEAERRDGS